MDRVVVYLSSTGHHFSQLLAGLEFLSQNKKIAVRYILGRGTYPINILRIKLNDLNVYFDLGDNSRINKAVYDKSDFYVKRMLLKTDYRQLRKVIPYGLYFPVYYRNPTLKFLFLKERKLFKFSLKYWKFFSNILHVKDGIAVNGLSKMESPPAGTTGVTFSAMLWDPAKNDLEWKKEERTFMNNQRVEIIRLLKEKFPTNFAGGIRQDDLSMVQCPDLMLSKEEYHRKSYLRNLKTSSIGIVNQGLEDSIGAKMGEYVAHSMVVVTNSIEKYELPGSFRERENYLTYTTNEHCVNLVEKLIQDSTLRQNIQKNNFRYYNEYLHPAKKVENIFSQISSSKNHF